MDKVAHASGFLHADRSVGSESELNWLKILKRQSKRAVQRIRAAGEKEDELRDKLHTLDKKFAGDGFKELKAKYEKEFEHWRDEHDAFILLKDSCNEQILKIQVGRDLRKTNEENEK